MRIRLKPAVWERDGEELHVMVDQREMRTLEDPDGRVEELLRLLSSGAHTPATLAAGMAGRFADVTEQDVEEGIAGLDSLGMVEDTAGDGSLSDWQRDRFYTNLVFFQMFASLEHRKEEMQQRLLDAHVLVLGTGGVGANVLMHLVGAGIGRFTLVEHDVVEERNFSRQFIYRHADIGRLKVERAREWASEYSPGTDVLALNRMITSPRDVAELLDGTGTDLVVGAIDTPPLEVGSWINDACVAAGVPYVRGGMGVQSGYFSVDPGRSACFECNRREMLDEQDQPGAVGARWRLLRRATLVNRGVGPIAGQISALVAMEALRYLTRFTEPVAAGVDHSYDLSEGGAETITTWERRADCPACATAGTAADSATAYRERQVETVS
jgi:molybdopterin-synthase adenylyltransferase